VAVGALVQLGYACKIKAFPILAASTGAQRVMSFCFTYGDGVADVDIIALVAFHRTQGRLATLTAVQPPGRYEALQLQGERVTGFQEKPQGDGGWINGRVFVLSPQVIDYIAGDIGSAPDLDIEPI